MHLCRQQQSCNNRINLGSSRSEPSAQGAAAKPRCAPWQLPNVTAQFLADQSPTVSRWGTLENFGECLRNVCMSLHGALLISSVASAPH